MFLPREQQEELARLLELRAAMRRGTPWPVLIARYQRKWNCSLEEVVERMVVLREVMRACLLLPAKKPGNGAINLGNSQFFHIRRFERFLRTLEAACRQEPDERDRASSPLPRFAASNAADSSTRMPEVDLSLPISFPPSCHGDTRSRGPPTCLSNPISPRPGSFYLRGGMPRFAPS